MYETFCGNCSHFILKWFQPNSFGESCFLCSRQWAPWTHPPQGSSKIRRHLDVKSWVYKFRDWWIFTDFIFGHGESSPTCNKIEAWWILKERAFYCFNYLYLKVNLDVEKTNQLGESSPNLIFAVVNLDPVILEKRWIDGESWPNDFVEKVNRGEDLRWVGSRCPLTHALEKSYGNMQKIQNLKILRAPSIQHQWVCL